MTESGSAEAQATGKGAAMCRMRAETGQARIGGGSWLDPAASKRLARFGSPEGFGDPQRHAGRACVRGLGGGLRGAEVLWYLCNVVCLCVLVAQLCLILCYLMGCNSPGSSCCCC